VNTRVVRMLVGMSPHEPGKLKGIPLPTLITVSIDRFPENRTPTRYLVMALWLGTREQIGRPILSFDLWSVGSSRATKQRLGCAADFYRTVGVTRVQEIWSGSRMPWLPSSSTIKR
jgi:hypothetical protein